MTATTNTQPLVETFVVDPLALNEGKNGSYIKKLSDSRYRVRCKGQHCYIPETKAGLQRNRNGRRYPVETTWGKHTQPGTDFYERVASRRVTGQLEHPPDGKSAMGLAAIVVTEVAKPSPKDGVVMITFETMSTDAGRVVEAYIRDGVGFGLSSRGNGSVETAEGVDEVQPDFVPITFDCVVDESTPGAEVAARTLREARKRLLESANGDTETAERLAQREVEEAVRRDLLTETQANNTLGWNVPEEAEAHEERLRQEERARQESYVVGGLVPISGTMVTLRFDSGAEAKQAALALGKAGFQVHPKGEDQVSVYTQYEDPTQAEAHILRVLQDKKIEPRDESFGLIRRGRIVWESEMASNTELLQDIQAQLSEMMPAVREPEELEEFEDLFDGDDPDDEPEDDDRRVFPARRWMDLKRASLGFPSTDEADDDEFDDDDSEDLFDDEDDEPEDGDEPDDEPDDELDDEPEEACGDYHDDDEFDESLDEVSDDMQKLVDAISAHEKKLAELKKRKRKKEKSEAVSYADVPAGQGFVRCWLDEDENVIGTEYLSEKLPPDQAKAMFATQFGTDDRAKKARSGTATSGRGGTPSKKTRKGGTNAYYRKRRKGYAKKHGLNQNAAIKNKRKVKKESVEYLSEKLPPDQAKAMFATQFGTDDRAKKARSGTATSGRGGTPSKMTRKGGTNAYYRKRRKGYAKKHGLNQNAAIKNKRKVKKESVQHDNREDLLIEATLTLLGSPYSEDVESGCRMVIESAVDWPHSVVIDHILPCLQERWEDIDGEDELSEIVGSAIDFLDGESDGESEFEDEPIYEVSDDMQNLVDAISAHEKKLAELKKRKRKKEKSEAVSEDETQLRAENERLTELVDAMRELHMATEVQNKVESLITAHPSLEKVRTKLESLQTEEQVVSEANTYLAFITESGSSHSTTRSASTNGARPSNGAGGTSVSSSQAASGLSVGQLDESNLNQPPIGGNNKPKGASSRVAEYRRRQRGQ